MRAIVLPVLHSSMPEMERETHVRRLAFRGFDVSELPVLQRWEKCFVGIELERASCR